MDNSFLILIIIALVLFFVLRFMNKFKAPAIGAVCLVNGGVKCGKTTYAVFNAYCEYKARHFSWSLRKFFYKVFFIKGFNEEEPLLYSNIPLNIKGVKVHKVTTDLLLRKKRFNYRSVILLSEFSLVADSQLVQDKEINDKLLEYFKLIGHETKGGCIIVDTQSISDCHYSLKRCLDRHIYIYKCVKWIPFFLLMYVREERYAEDGTVVNSYNEDLEEKLERVIIPKRVWKFFDTYCYSAMTDNLTVDNSTFPKGTLKVFDYVTFKRKKMSITDLKNKYNKGV